MPTSCVSINHCGANAPGWINGTHPSAAQGVSTVQVCFNWGHKCCRYSTNIRVRNCSGFYVYKLTKTPACRLRYCGNGAQGTAEKPYKTNNNKIVNDQIFKMLRTWGKGKIASPVRFEPMTQLDPW